MRKSFTIIIYSFAAILIIGFIIAVATGQMHHRNKVDESTFLFGSKSQLCDHKKDSIVKNIMYVHSKKKENNLSKGDKREHNNRGSLKENMILKGVKLSK